MKTETKTYLVTRSWPEFGRSSVHVRCPFCWTETKAYLWSLAGCGKKCQCGAKFSSNGTITRITP